MKIWLGALALLAVSCEVNSPPPPVAHLDAPKCAVVGKPVWLNGTTSEEAGGEITLYSFRIGHNNAWISTREPVLEYTFTQPEMKDGMLAQTVIVLEVRDVNGATSQDTALTWVIYDPSQCPAGALPPEPDILTQDVTPDVTEEYEPAPDEMTPDVPASETDSTAPPLDIASDTPEDAGAECPSIAGNWKLQAYCGGSTKAELELAILQNPDCTFVSDPEVLSGTVHSDGAVEVSSDIPQLYMGQCFGTIEESDMFTVDCSTGCTVQFTSIP
ncbi:MAG: hypothetical protein FJ109_00880 [Deltaproteobacteria bacterium]|nr:hypothetical protein [Deltaproteobacteria bacterium]